MSTLFDTLVCSSPPMPLPSLEQYLQFHENAVKAIVARLGPEGDINPMFWFLDCEGRHWSMMPTFEDKDLEAAMFKFTLERVGAPLYAMISSAWMSDALTPEEAETYEREGWTEELKKRRTEVANIIVGDKHKTVLRDYKMIRSPTGVSLELIPREPDLITHGRWIDLLVTKQ